MWRRMPKVSTFDKREWEIRGRLNKKSKECSAKVAETTEGETYKQKKKKTHLFS